MIDLKKLRKAAEAATQGDWWLGHSDTKTIKAAKKYFSNLLDWNPTNSDLWMVGVGNWKNKNECVITALTGNGPTSEANADFISLSSPQTVLALLDELEAAEEQIKLLKKGEK